MAALRWVLAAFLAGAMSSGAAGCGLALDYGPPDPVRGMDAGRADAGSVACVMGDVCDDGLICTVDACVDGTCDHASACRAGVDCVARGAGECASRCTRDEECDDQSACTTDACSAADGHCTHASTCDAAAPVCLPTGACVPAHCAVDADCDDQNACNGSEHCTGGVCTGGVPVICEQPIDGCAAMACEARFGECRPVPDDGRCDDAIGCTVDRCLARDGGFACSHAPSDVACEDGNACTVDRCDPLTGCVGTSVACPITAPCITSATCEAATGACVFESSCVDPLVCTAAGCVDAPCTSDTDCSHLVDPTGCMFFCGPEGACVQEAHCADHSGCASADALCAVDASACHYHPDDARCDDSDPTTLDRCDPGTFTCQHTCADLPGDCFTVTLDPGTGRCVPVPDDRICESMHGTPAPTDCTEWLCVGGGASDGCARLPLARNCDDGRTCTEDVCGVQTDGSGTCARTPDDTACDDGAACSTDRCDPSVGDPASGCVHRLNDPACSVGVTFECAELYCAGGSRPGPVLGGMTYPTGCAVRYRPCGGGGPPDAALPDGGLFGPDARLPDGGGTTFVRYCSPSTGTCVTGGGSCSLGCDDGNRCNGIESCAGSACAPGAPVVCGIDPFSNCPLVCEPATGACVPPGAFTCTVT